MQKIKNVFVFGSVLLVVIVFFLVNRPQEFKQYVYPLEAAISSYRSSCSEGAPKEIHALLDFSRKELGSLATQIAFLNGYGELYHCEQGWSDHLFGKPLNPNNRYRYASITKLITADLILRLIEEKKLSFDTRIVDIFSEIKDVRDSRVEQITIENLLDHSGGFNRLTPEGDVMFFSAKKKWCPFNIQQLSFERLNFTPGEKQIYSNVGYCLLGAVVEKVTGTEFKEYAQIAYDLKGMGIEFVDGAYLRDEVRYDFRFDPTHTENYYKKYDLVSAKAAVGLSGSAIALVQLIQKVLSRPGLSLLELPKKYRCKIKIEKCFGLAFSYHQVSSGAAYFIHDGYLPGVTSVIVVDSNGNIFVMLGTGRGLDQYEAERKSHKIIMNFLSNSQMLKSKR